MTYAQQINQEPEALENESKLTLVQKYLPETETYLSYKYRIKNRRHVLKKLQRAGVAIKAQKTDKTRKLHPKATLIAETVLNKIAYGGEEEVILTHKYLHTITDCLADQNKRHIRQLANLFHAEYKRAYLKDGKFYEYCYVFKLNPEIIKELKEDGVLESEFIPAKKPRSINNKDISNEIKIRSSRANFFNSNFNSQDTSTEFIENSSVVAKKGTWLSFTNTQMTEQSETLYAPHAVEITSPTQTPITKHRENAFRPSNNVVMRNGFLGGSKHISEIQPYLTDELCETLRSNSGKLFTNQAIRQITKAIAASRKGKYVEFKHMNGIVSYLTTALANEKRKPNKIGNDSYYTLAGMTAEDKLLHEREKYLNEAENFAIYARCDYTQYRARIAGQFPFNLAYTLLINMVEVKREEYVLKIKMHKLVPLGENQVQLLLNHAKGIGGYAGVNKLEFVEIANNCNLKEPEKKHELELPKGKWGKICFEFVAEFGMNMYKHWIAPLRVVEKEGVIELSTSSDMARDRIEQNYLPFLSKRLEGGELYLKEVLNREK